MSTELGPLDEWISKPCHCVHPDLKNPAADFTKSNCYHCHEERERALVALVLGACEVCGGSGISPSFAQTPGPHPCQFCLWVRRALREAGVEVPGDEGSSGHEARSRTRSKE